MKRIAFMILALVLVSGTAFAAGGQAGSGVSVDLSGNYASEPASGFDGTFGVELGANADLNRLGINLATSKSVELQGRASLSYYNWDESFFGQDFEYRRIPFFLGARVLAPMSPQVKVYGQLGLEISFDRVELYNPVFGKVSESDTNLGLTPGVGILFPVSNQFYLGGNLSWHIISDDYFTLGVTVGFNIP
ncbi:MAG: outer membrane beta-barrel protein [Gemmatimonadota bacterium]